jgi:hypothetical protein
MAEAFCWHFQWLTTARNIVPRLGCRLLAHIRRGVFGLAAPATLAAARQQLGSSSAAKLLFTPGLARNIRAYDGAVDIWR